MKVAFNILPVITAYEQVHLLIELGNYGICFAWFTRDPYDVSGIAVYNLGEDSHSTDMAAEIENVLRSAPIFSKQYASVTVCYDFKESLLVPAAYHSEATAQSMLELMYASDAEDHCKSEPVEKENCFVVYTVYQEVEKTLLRHFPSANSRHATSLQLDKLNRNGKILHCIFFHNSIKIFLFDNEALQIVQQFRYSLPVDASYQLLNCCERYDIRPSDLTLVLSGMIEEKSKLYAELYKYFLNIEFAKPDEQISLHDRIKFYPPHFFSHITGLASCVS